MGAPETDISWAMKLLTADPEHETNLLAKNWFYICGTMAGIALPMMMNYWLKRPLSAGIQRHVIFGITGFGIGHLITEQEKFLLGRNAELYRDYIRLHPEDFPPPDRKKWGEIFEPWVPIR